ncbi:hypothetical protein AB205_0169770, partial [Aquarana catesbeiana]
MSRASLPFLYITVHPPYLVLLLGRRWGRRLEEEIGDRVSFQKDLLVMGNTWTALLLITKLEKALRWVFTGGT